MPYRDPAPVQDATFTYGPFDGRWWRVLASLLALVVGVISAVDLERDSFKALDCQRPGQCVVTRGGSFFGGHTAETFAVDSVERAELRRTTGKSPHDVLVLVLHGGDEIELLTGDRVEGELPRVQAYFAGADSALSVTGNSQPELTVLCAIIALTGAVLTVLFLVLGLRARIRFRVSILAAKGELRIERMGSAAPQGLREVRITDIVGVAFEGASGASDRGEGVLLRAARVVICTREGLDVPICESFHKDSAAHRTLANDLRDALRLTPSEVGR